ncbi:MAG: ATP-binding protein [Myxococcales bacterium]|nr:ATP-binding protein [Myxococcales bacterium]
MESVFSRRAGRCTARCAAHRELCWRVENLAREGGFAFVTGAPGIGKSSVLRLLVERLGALREVKIGVMARPHMGVADFYRELGDLFGVQLSPRNRWAGAKLLRERWQSHIDAALVRPVLVVDEAQDMSTVVLNEMRHLSSARLDSHMLLTTVLAGDTRLVEKFRNDEDLLPLASRMRVKLNLDRATPEELEACLRHCMTRTFASVEKLEAWCERARMPRWSGSWARRRAGSRWRARTAFAATSAGSARSRALDSLSAESVDSCQPTVRGLSARALRVHRTGRVLTRHRHRDRGPCPRDSRQECPGTDGSTTVRAAASNDCRTLAGHGA